MGQRWLLFGVKFTPLSSLCVCPSIILTSYLFRVTGVLESVTAVIVVQTGTNRQTITSQKIKKCKLRNNMQTPHRVTTG